MGIRVTNYNFFNKKNPKIALGLQRLMTKYEKPRDK